MGDAQHLQPVGAANPPLPNPLVFLYGPPPSAT